MLTYALKKCLINSFNYLTEDIIKNIEDMVQDEEIKITLIKNNNEFSEKTCEVEKVYGPKNIVIKNVAMKVIYREGNIKIGKKIYKKEEIYKLEKTIMNPKRRYVVLK